MKFDLAALERRRDDLWIRGAKYEAAEWRALVNDALAAARAAEAERDEARHELAMLETEILDLDRESPEARELTALRKRCGDALLLGRLVAEVVPCRCAPDFKKRDLIDPACAYCEYGDDLIDAIREYAAAGGEGEKP